MLMHKVVSTHGRLISKPKKPQPREEVLEEHLTIQDQIENLRTKIGLKEKYTRVLTETFEESRLGASSILRELYFETRELRSNLIAGINSESQAVQNVLRIENEFRLAMNEQAPVRAIPWLDDKLYDRSKIFNALLDTLQKKRMKLQEAEHQIVMMEKWPRPGTIPWEIIAFDRFHKIENVIENIRIKRETAFILNIKYRDIKTVLKEEKVKYMPNIRVLENQFRVHKFELQSLNQMLNEANTFREDTYKNLVLTEIEASENRKVRRQQMTKMRKKVEKVLAENHAIKPQLKTTNYGHDDEDVQHDIGNTIDLLRKTRIELVSYEERVQNIVRTMRVQDLTEIPTRHQKTKQLGRSLKQSKVVKVVIRDDLVKQNNYLNLLLCNFKYMGAKQEEQYRKRQIAFQHALGTVEKQLVKTNSKIEEYGDVMINLRLGVLGTLARFDDRNTQKKHRSGDLKYHLRNLYSKTRRIVRDVEHLQSLFEKKEKESRKRKHLKLPPVPLRLIRAGYGEAEISESEGDDDDLPDSHVPGRLEIKTKGQRVKQQAILKRGLK